MTKGRELAELLRDILSESEAFGNGEVSESTLEITGKVIQQDIDKGELVPDENGAYYHTNFDSEYGNLIIKDLEAENGTYPYEEFNEEYDPREFSPEILPNN